MKILIFNWHEAYLSLLASVGHEWEVAHWHRPWNPRFRALPANARLVSDPAEAVRLVQERAVDLVVCQTAQDLAWLAPLTARVLFLTHNHLGNEVARGDVEAATRLRAAVVREIEARSGVFVAISPMKLESWSIPGVVIPPGVNLDDFDPAAYTGETASALTVANMLAERGHMLGGAQLAEALVDLPWRLIGSNPALNTVEAESWDVLRAAYRTHRFYAHATLWPWEDGYNLAMLEAMASGQPIVTWTNPTSPITNGVDGFIAGGAQAFRQGAVRLLEDMRLARQLGAAGRRTVAERFPYAAFVERWRDVLDRAAAAPLLRRPRPGPALAEPRMETISIGPEEVGGDPPSVELGGDPSSPPKPPSSRGGRTVPTMPPGDALPARAARARRATELPRDARRIVLATAWTPISTSTYYERAFRASHDVLTWGPSMDEETFAEWHQVTDQHELKASGTAEEKIRLLRGLSRPADIPARRGAPAISDLLEQLPRGWRPDLFVWIDGGAGFVPREIRGLDCPTVCLVGDSHTQMHWRREYARSFSHVFVMFNRQHVPTFREAGCTSVAWLPAACDPVIHRAHDVEPAFDVVFVGQTLRQWHPDRVRLLERLIAAGFDVHVSTRILEEMSLAFGRGHIVFNRSLAGDLNMRVFEALASGRLLLTDRLAPESGLGDLFEDRVDLVCYDEHNLETLARFYLDHEEERLAIAAAGRQKVLAHHTYGHRVATILESVLGVTPAEVARNAPGRTRTVREAPAQLGASARHVPAPPSPSTRRRIAALVPLDARVILDVGCASGIETLPAPDTGRQVIGIDPAGEGTPPAGFDRVLGQDLDAVEALPLEEGSVDCIVCADGLQQLRRPEHVLALLRRYLAPGGTIVVSSPNPRHADVLLPLLVDGRAPAPAPAGTEDGARRRAFTVADVSDLITGAGFTLRGVDAERTEVHPAVATLADAVTSLGGDGERFRQESAIVSFVVTATASPAPTPAPIARDQVAVPGRAPDVSVVIPVWNCAAFTARCLAALAATIDPADTEVIVVNNGSTDGTADVLRAAPLRLHVVENRDNLGFARASNQGAAIARGSLLVFLNNDTEPEPGWLDALRAAVAEPGVGIAGARLLYPGTRRIQHAGLALDPDGIPDHLWRNALADDPRVTEPRDVEMVTGACMAVGRRTFEELGGFDEAYANGVEDVDLCLAARHRGLRVRYEPRAVVLHHEGVTEGRFAHVTENLCRFFEKWATALARMERRPRAEFGSLPGPSVAWEGSFFLHHSLAGINRAVCGELLEQGVDIVPLPYEVDEFDPASVPGSAALAQLVGRPVRTAPAIRVRHRFPPDWSREPGEKLVVIQPWEFGAVPVEWARGIRESVDELWVPSEFVRQSYVAGGVPPERVVTIPNGFDPALFHPDAAPMPLPTARRFRFLYVGGSIGRKGYDLLVRAYVEEFTADDDVCLVIKDHAYYRNRIDEVLASIRRADRAPEILYYWDNVLPQHVAGFYTASTCLVHPFRGEGFGLPVLEAMACGRPVIVTDAGPVREFCPPDVATFVPATVTRLPDRRVDYLETVDFPTLAEPDVAALRRAMRAAYADPEGCAARGRRAAAHAHAGYTWRTIAARYAHRLQALVSAPAPVASDGAALESGLSLLSAGRLAEALRVFAEVIKREPDNVEALVGAAHCAIALDEAAGARVLLERILALDPDNAPAGAALRILDEGARGHADPHIVHPDAGGAPAPSALRSV